MLKQMARFESVLLCVRVIRPPGGCHLTHWVAPLLAVLKRMAGPQQQHRCEDFISVSGFRPPGVATFRTLAAGQGTARAGLPAGCSASSPLSPTEGLAHTCQSALANTM